jgi:BirA family transcriptional regulator, biotin operon repressor / biotin---[acetyl-CoA-carboxylase] ligase
MTLSDTEWHSHALQQALAPQWPGFTVEVVQDIDSTNAELMSRARAGHHEPILLVAKHQSAGQGRLGRRWYSGNGSLTFPIDSPRLVRVIAGCGLERSAKPASRHHAEVA